MFLQMFTTFISEGRPELVNDVDQLTISIHFIDFFVAENYASMVMGNGRTSQKVKVL